MMQLHLGILVGFILERSLTISGKVIKTIVIGDENISDSMTYLQKAIEDYTRALSTFNTGINIKVLEVVKGVTLFFCANLHSRIDCVHEISQSE
jgi:hypothetical protein